METGFKDCILTVLGEFFSLLSTVEVKSFVWKVLKKNKIFVDNFFSCLIKENETETDDKGLK